MEMVYLVVILAIIAFLVFTFCEVRLNTPRFYNIPTFDVEHVLFRYNNGETPANSWTTVPAHLGKHLWRNWCKRPDLHVHGEIEFKDPKTDTQLWVIDSECGRYQAYVTKPDGVPIF